ncbi:FadR family transcriptional regulator [Aureimonas fodinaquatilis]|uniref:FadR family transcriptional regulator n=1 Tax=Aureimonas fodinaquatilis TaxID=2565783 RepID=A0A5B0DXF8_9HYPH|nr:FCD domain-containing protein [Aureimonas fodinaquatilis]KAA0970240.1 FadR family transcriptional regulator [Aureimonas fodinaquatilis]
MTSLGETPLLAEYPAFQEAIVKRPIRDVIADKIAMLIASGILQVGDALPSERDLAVSLSVSRDAVRSAVQALAARGILEISHGARTRVLAADVGPVMVGLAQARAVDAYDIDSVHAARMLVERQLVLDAALRHKTPVVKNLHQLLNAQRATLNDPVRFLICDREFHVAIYQASGNRLLADFATDLYTYMMEHRRRAVAQQGAVEQSYHEHCAIVTALEAGDGEAAAAAFSVHTGRIYATTQMLLEKGVRKS